MDDRELHRTMRGLVSKLPNLLSKTGSPEIDYLTANILNNLTAVFEKGTQEDADNIRVKLLKLESMVRNSNAISQPEVLRAADDLGKLIQELGSLIEKARIKTAAGA